jgi:hypothetical protein
MKLLFTILVLISFQANAEIAPDQVDSMIDQMVSNNVISKEDAEKAKIRMRTMTPEQWAQINTQAEKIAARTPASENTVSSNKIEEVHGIDLEGKQFQQIQNDMKKFVP